MQNVCLIVIILKYLLQAETTSSVCGEEHPYISTFYVTWSVKIL